MFSRAFQRSYTFWCFNAPRASYICIFSFSYHGLSRLCAKFPSDMHIAQCIGTSMFSNLAIFRRVRIPIRGLVHRFVGWSVGNAFVKLGEKWNFTDSKWFRQCWTRKKEGRGGTRRKGGRGGRSDEEEGALRRKGATRRVKKMKKLLKNEKVARGRIVDPRGLVDGKQWAKLVANWQWGLASFSKLEPFAWSHWIQNYEKYLWC